MKIPIFIFLFFFSAASLLGQQQITGEVVSPLAVPICDVLVELIDENQEVIALDMTEEDGSFLFATVETDASYTLRFSREDSNLNGMSTFDLVILARYILGLDQFSNPYFVWAADVNGSGTATTLDMVLIRKGILGLLDDFPVEPWVFDSEETPATTQPDNLVEITVNEEDVDVAIIGVKVGDVNGSATGDCQ